MAFGWNVGILWDQSRQLLTFQPFTLVSPHLFWVSEALFVDDALPAVKTFLSYYLYVNSSPEVFYSGKYDVLSSDDHGTETYCIDQHFTFQLECEKVLICIFSQNKIVLTCSPSI